MTCSQHPRWAGSSFYGLHSARVLSGYTVITRGGHVIYCCDTDCLQRFLAARVEENIRADRPALRRLGR
jgi:hypothetical protein